MLPLLLLGCAFGPGQGFGELEAASLTAVFSPGAARDLGGGEVLSQDGYAVRVDTLALDLGDVELLALSGGGSATFDPANPPEGYTLCHGGHCHSESGALVDYADIEAELAGGAASFSAVVTLPVGEAADLLDGAVFDFDVAPYAYLPAADVSKVEVGVSALRLEGEVRRHPDDGWRAPITVALPLEGAFGAGFDLPLDRAHDPVVTLSIALAPDGTLFDGLDLAALATEDGVMLDDPDDPGAAELAAAVLATAPAATVERAP